MIPPGARGLDPQAILGFARQHLGPHSAAALSRPEVQAVVGMRMRAGSALEDAVLAAVHGLAPRDGRVADEFTAFFLTDLLRLGHGHLSPGLRRFLDTGDLVQSVLGDLWPELSKVRFETRAQFFSYLSQRLRWKASDRGRGLRAARRREDLRASESPEDLQVQAGGASPSSVAGAREDRERLALLLLRLSESDRDILRLHLAGASLEELAAATGRTREAARKALQRAIQRARELGS